MLGWYPCSTVSEEEAADLVSAVSPGALYIDLHPELVRALSEDVAAGRSSADGRAWRVPERSGPTGRISGAGFLVSLNLRNMLADNEMFALLGAEAFGAIKAALGAARALPPADTPRVVTFPFDMSYNNGLTLSRPLDATALLVGDASVGSTRVTAVVGNPNAWQYVSDDVTKNAPAVEYVVAIPSNGYFSADDVTRTRVAFRAAVNSVLSKATAESLDIDRDLQEREAECSAKGDEGSAQLLADRAMVAQSMSSAVAWTLQAEADAEVAAAAAANAANTANSGGAAAGARVPAAAVARPIVALVNLGAINSLKRTWVAPIAPEVAMPPFSTAQVAIGNIVPVIALSGLTYGVYRAARRFPRTTATLGVVTAFGLGAVLYTTAYGDWTRYGVVLREKIASPRITSPLARINR